MDSGWWRVSLIILRSFEEESVKQQTKRSTFKISPSFSCAAKPIGTNPFALCEYSFGPPVQYTQLCWLRELTHPILQVPPLVFPIQAHPLVRRLSCEASAQTKRMKLECTRWNEQKLPLLSSVSNYRKMWDVPQNDTTLWKTIDEHYSPTPHRTASKTRIRPQIWQNVDRISMTL